MKYEKLVLNASTAETIRGHLSLLISGAIVRIDGAWGDQDPTDESVQFTQKPSFHRNRTVSIRTKALFTEPSIVISSEGIGWYGSPAFRFGDTFYIGEDVIFVRSGKPEGAEKKIQLQRITLLSRADEPEAMKPYREYLSCMINMCCYYNGNDRLNIPSSEIDEHIAFLEAYPGEEIKNPRYKESNHSFDLDE
ncbi:MAG: hypothetical protein V4478_02655 [Patescibacteria group bacterium]